MKLHHTKSSFWKQCMSDKAFDVVNVTLMVVLAAVFLWPLSASFSDPAAVTLGKVWLFPKGFTLEGYKAIFEYKNIWIGYPRFLHQRGL
jgi:putative aldouronate transport system permease protein